MPISNVFVIPGVISLSIMNKVDIYILIIDKEISLLVF